MSVQLTMPSKLQTIILILRVKHLSLQNHKVGCAKYKVIGLSECWTRTILLVCLRGNLGITPCSS
uniref:Uncharacterized protein n=1 Tax=Rhizophora mucronata TaxID=61149 RepID=A0A2P2QYS4_RHIMU